MSKTFRRDPDASPFADRREAFKRGDKRDTFAMREQERQASARALALRALDGRALDAAH